MLVLEHADLFTDVFGGGRGHKQRDADNTRYLETVLDGIYSIQGHGLEVYGPMAATRSNAAITGHVIQDGQLLHLWPQGNVKRIPKRGKHNPFTAQMSCGLTIPVSLESSIRSSKWWNTYQGDVALDDPQCCPHCKANISEFPDLDLNYNDDELFGRVMPKMMRDELWSRVHSDILETQRLPIYTVIEVARDSLRNHGHQLMAEKFVAQQKRILQLVFPGKIVDLNFTKEDILKVLHCNCQRNKMAYQSFTIEEQCEHAASDLTAIIDVRGYIIENDTIALSAEYEKRK